MNRKKWLAAGAALLVVLIAGTGLFYLKPAGNGGTGAPDAGAMVPEQPKDIVAWGEVKYGVVYDIIVDFPATVTHLAVKDGDRVVKGQTLATLDMADYEASIEKLAQQLLLNEAGLKNVMQDTAALQADIAQLKKDISRKTDELNSGKNASLKILEDSLALTRREAENARRDVDNYRQLYDSGAVSEEILHQYTDALYQREKAVSDVANNIEKLKRDLQAELDQLNLSLKAKQVQLSQIESANIANSEKQSSLVAVSKIDLENMKNRSAKSYISGDRIVANVDNGIVQNIRAIYGTRLGIQNAPTSVMQLIDAASIVVSAEIDEEFIKNIVMDESVKIVPEFDDTLVIPGTVTQISNIAAEKDGKRIVKVEVKPEDPEGLLKPGYTADVYFPAGRE